MSAHACCPVVPGGDVATRAKGASSGSALAGVGKVGSWLGPSAALVLLPKCPMCLAGYLALAGIGVSMPVAAGIRVGAIAICVTVLGLVVIKSVARVLQ
jgi:hypothetical protein